MSELKTIKVVSKDETYHGGKPFTINEADFNEEKHELAEAPEKPKGKGKDKGEPKGDDSKNK